jgi:hypothetical protein
MLSATGPIQIYQLVPFGVDKVQCVPLVTLWVMGWFLMASAAAEASTQIVSCVVEEL